MAILTTLRSPLSSSSSKPYPDPETLAAASPRHARSPALAPVADPPRVKSGVLSNSRCSFIAPIQAVTAERAFVWNGYKKDLKPIIVIDNYDSFTYNLCQTYGDGYLNAKPIDDWTNQLLIYRSILSLIMQYMGDLGASFEVYRNDEITVEEIKRKQPRGILISPGPGTPQDSGISLQTVLELGPSIPLFGVCMGLQCIGEAFGGKIVRSPSGVVHGKSSLVYYDEKLVDTLFSGVPNPFQAGRYHSLVIEKGSFPSDALEVVAWTEDGLVMAARHKKYKHIQGVQFHPESIITPEGKTMVQNFIKLIEDLEGSSSLPRRLKSN